MPNYAQICTKVEAVRRLRLGCGFHNHILAKDLDGYDILGRLKDHERKFVNDMTKCNMTLRYIVVALKDRDSKNLTSVTQVYKVRYTYKTSKRGPLAEFQHLLSLIHKDKYIYWTKNKDSSNFVVDIF